MKGKKIRFGTGKSEMLLLLSLYGTEKYSCGLKKQTIYDNIKLSWRTLHKKAKNLNEVQYGNFL